MSRAVSSQASGTAGDAEGGSPSALPDALRARIAESLARQGLMVHLGCELLEAQAGRVVLRLPFGERVTQQQGSFHGGAISALADIAGGYAALTLAPEAHDVVTVEYKINFLNACRGGHLLATGRVLKAGRRVIVTMAEVEHHADDGSVRPCAVMQQTIAPVPA